MYHLLGVKLVDLIVLLLLLLWVDLHMLYLIYCYDDDAALLREVVRGTAVSRMVGRARSTSASEEKMRQEGDGGAQAEVGLILEMTIELAVAHATKPDGTAIIMHAKTIALI